MRKSFNIILSLVLLTSVFSCSKDESIFKEGYGYLKMNLSANEEINIETKAPGEVYAFDILDAAGKAVESYTDHRELQGKPIKPKTLGQKKYVHIKLMQQQVRMWLPVGIPLSIVELRM